MDGKHFKAYIFEKDIKPYGDNEKILPYKSFFLISYITYNDDYEEIPEDCKFNISKITDSYNNIKIKFNYLLFFNNI